MKLHYLPIFMVILSGLGYHLCQKSIPASVNPIAAFIVTYLSALLISIAAFFLLSPGTDMLASLKSTNLTSVLLGVAVVALELGFMLVYRAGWNVSTTGLLSNTLVSVLLIPAGILLYKEHISLVSLSGVAICIVGLILISKG